MNRLYYGDNLNVLRRHVGERVRRSGGELVPDLPRLTINVGRANGFYRATFDAETADGKYVFLGRGPSIERAVDAGMEKIRGSIRVRKGRTPRSVKILRDLMIGLRKR